MDDVLAYHTDFLNNCLKDCMLTNPDLLKIVHKLMMVCVTFSNFIQVSTRDMFLTELQGENTSPVAMQDEDWVETLSGWR